MKSILVAVLWFVIVSPALADSLTGNGLGPVGIFRTRTGRERNDSLRMHGGSVATEKAVLNALRWLTEHQNPNGSWDCDGGKPAGHGPGNPGVLGSRRNAGFSNLRECR